MHFGLRQGPWRTVFEGTFEGHEMEIGVNPEQAMLVMLFEKDRSSISGVIMQSYYLFSAVGEAETFLESLQNEAVILSRHDGKQTLQFLAVPSRPVFSKPIEEEVAKNAEILLKQAAEAGTKTASIAKSFDLQLTPLAKCSSSVKQAFFSQPIVIPMLAKEGQAIEIEKEEAIVETGSTEGAAVVLGMTKAGRHVKEPLQIFNRVLVTDGTLPQRVHAIQIIVESYLLANTSVVIFDGEKNFDGLAHPTSKKSELQGSGIGIEPIGFPTKEFIPGENVKINLNLMNPAGLLQFFGCEDKEMQKIFEAGLRKGSVESTQQLIENIESLDESAAENQFLKKRCERAAKLMDITYPELLDGGSNVEEIAKSWYSKIGRASIVNTGGLDARELTLLFYSLSKELAELCRQQPNTGKPKLMVCIPQVEKVFSVIDNIVLSDFIKVLAEMKRFGIGFVLGSEKVADLPKEVKTIIETRFGIIKENDVAIDMPNAKNYRLFLRPTLSQTKEG